MEPFSALLAICAGNSPVRGEFPNKGQWRRALMFSLICAWINSWVNNREAGDLRRHRAHYDVIVMIPMVRMNGTLSDSSDVLYIYCSMHWIPLLNVIPFMKWPQFAICMSKRWYRADSRFVPSEWEMMLICSKISHCNWLGANLESALFYISIGRYWKVSHRQSPFKIMSVFPNV